MYVSTTLRDKRNLHHGSINMTHIVIDCRIYGKVKMKVFDGKALLHESTKKKVSDAVLEIAKNIRLDDAVIENIRFIVSNPELTGFSVGNGDSIITIQLTSVKETGLEDTISSHPVNDTPKTKGEPMAKQKDPIEYVDMKNKAKSDLLEEYISISKKEKELKGRKDELKELLRPIFEASVKDKMFLRTINGHNIQIMRQTRVGSLNANKLMEATGLEPDEFDKEFRGKDSILFTVKENLT
jgi:hypothetical protein